jgi:predicted AlkP superfamily pyrophosphatase or phosphodiesterase
VVAALAASLTLPAAGHSMPTDAPRSAETLSLEPAQSVDTVLAISIDGLRVRTLRRLGWDGAPHIHRLVREGASTFNARTERELTLTLPNHTGMVTGRRIAADSGGHGVTWNDDRPDPATVQEAAGHPVQSVFTVVRTQAGGSSAVFAGKTKLSLWERSWPRAVNRYVARDRMGALVRTLRGDLRRRSRELRFLHLAAPDLAGHEHGWSSTAYADAVRRADTMVGRVMRLVRRLPRYRDHLAVVLTADHGATRAGHDDPTRLDSYRVPFVVRGPGVAAGADLYDLNPDYRDPGRRRTRYSDQRQPVRNGDVADLALDLLGLPPVEGSEHDAAQDLDVR